MRDITKIIRQFWTNANYLRTMFKEDIQGLSKGVCLVINKMWFCVLLKFKIGAIESVMMSITILPLDMYDCLFGTHCICLRTYAHLNK